MTTMTRPERWAHKAAVMDNPCRVCCNRIDTGERVFGEPVLACYLGLRLPKSRKCWGFELDEEI